MPTAKISIAIDKQQLKLARDAAKTEGISLSAYIGRALGNQLEDQLRLEAARELWKSWGRGSVPTPEERVRFLERMSRGAKGRTRAA